MNNVRTAVIAAAGYGTRFLPISKAVPKEMLPVLNKPVIHYAVEQACMAGIERVVIITSRGKQATEDYFDLDPNLDFILKKRNHPYSEELKKISSMAEIIYVRQSEQLGLGHAVLQAKKVVGQEPFIVYLPDELLLGSPSVSTQLIDSYNETNSSTVGVVEVGMKDLSRFGIVDIESDDMIPYKIIKVIEKPKINEAPSNLAITGPYIFVPEIFNAIEHTKPDAGGEIQLTDAINLLINSANVRAYPYIGERFDCGNPIDLIKASVHVALQSSEHSEGMKSWLRTLKD